MTLRPGVRVGTGAPSRVAQLLRSPGRVAGQGALALECRATDTDLVELLGCLDDEHTRAAVTAERSLLAALEAGCSAPVAALADVSEPEDGAWEIYPRGAVFSADGDVVLRLSGTGTLTDAREVGSRLAAELLAEGADHVLGEHA